MRSREVILKPSILRADQVGAQPNQGGKWLRLVPWHGPVAAGKLRDESRAYIKCVSKPGL